MLVELTIRMQIDLDDVHGEEPIPGGALEQKWLDATQEAVSNAISFIENNAGFEHSMAYKASIGFIGVQDCHQVEE